MADSVSINVRAVDTGASDVLRRYREQAQETARSITDGLTQQRNSSNLNIQNLEREISLMERRASLENRSRRAAVNMAFENDARVEYGGEQDRQDAVNERDDSLRELEEQKRQQEMTNLLLRQILEEQKKSWQEDLEQNRGRVEGEIRRGKSSWVGRNILGRQDYEGLDQEDQMRLRYQEGLIGQESGSSRINARGLNRVSSAAMDPMSAIGGLSAAGFSIGVPIAFALSQGNRLQGAAQGARGTFSVDDYTKFAGDDVVSSTASFGKSRADMLEFANAYAKSRMSADGIESESIELAAQQIAYSIDQGQMMSLGRFQGADSNGLSLSQDISQMIENFERIGIFSGGDYSSLSALLEVQNELLSQQTAIMENPSSTQNLKMMAVMNSIGGSFANPATMGSRMSTMNNAIRNPDNDFKKAAIFSSLRSMPGNEGLSYFEMLEQMENGLTPDLLQNLMGSLGGGDMGMIQAKELFGLSAQQSRTLVEGYKPGSVPSILDPSGGSAVSRANEISPPIISLTKTIEDTFGKGGAKLIDAVDSMTSKLAEFMGDENSTKNNTAETNKTLSKILNVITNPVGGVINAMIPE